MDHIAVFKIEYEKKMNDRGGVGQETSFTLDGDIIFLFIISRTRLSRLT